MFRNSQTLECRINYYQKVQKKTIFAERNNLNYMEKTCLNCKQDLTGNFCSNCGQSTSTHRFSLKHFLSHDFIHGVFHIDKGFLYTIKELFTRPGHSIREFIQGKRTKHFNYFSTVILILAIDYFIGKTLHFTDINTSDHLKGLFKIQKDYNKIVPFLTIPLYALLSFLTFKKSNQNYTENLVLNIYMLSGWLILNILHKVSSVFFPSFNNINIIAFSIFTFIYIFIFYYQYFCQTDIKKTVLIRKTLLITIAILVIKQATNNILNDIGMKYLN